jgi:hypothetical protein
MTFYLVSLIFHIFAAMFWVGGMLFYVLVLIVIIRDPEFKNVKLKLLEKTALQFRRVSYFTFSLLFLSGVGALSSKGKILFSNNILETLLSIPILFKLKIGLFLLLLLSSIYHDFFSGPAAFVHAENNPVLFEKFRKRSAFFGRLNLAISISIAVLGILGSRGFGN